MPSWTPSFLPRIAALARPPEEGPGRVERPPDGTICRGFLRRYGFSGGCPPGPLGSVVAEASWSLRVRVRRVTKPAAPAAIKSNATAPSTINGIGIEVALPGLVALKTCLIG